MLWDDTLPEHQDIVMGQMFSQFCISRPLVAEDLMKKLLPWQGTRSLVSADG